MYTKICDVCGDEFETKIKVQRMCRIPHETNCIICNKEYMLKKPPKNNKRRSCGSTACKSALTKLTNLEKYGVENVAQTEYVQNKIKNTNLEKYGVEHAFQSEEVKAKIIQTNLERYGTSDPRWYNEESREKAEATNLERYGAINPFGSEEIKEKIQQINIDRYGVPWTTQAEEVKEKMKNSHMERYGVDNPAKAKEIQDKMKATNLERYGSPNYMQSEIGKKAFEEILMDKYDVINISHLGITNYEDYLDLENFLKNTSKSITELGQYFNLPRLTIRKKIIELNLHNLFDDLYVNSVKEEEFINFLKNNHNLKNIEYIRNDRTILEGKELDFFFPQYNFAIEISPTYTHNSKIGWGGKGEGLSSTYHLQKFLGCLKKGIELITIFDWHDWDKILNMIEVKLMGASSIVYGRKTTYIEYNSINNDIFEKLSNWHILSLPSNYKRKNKVSVLEFENEIVGIALWEYNNKKNTAELKRMVFKPGIVVNGGASKLIKNYIKNNPEVNKIYTFSDCDLGTGNVYDAIGFQLIEESKPVLNYYNVKYNKHVKHLSLVRQGADRLLKDLPDYHPVGMGQDLPSNREIIESYDFLPIYDCGYRKWEMEVK